MSSSGMKISPCLSFQVLPKDPFTGGFGCVKEAWSPSGICGGSGLAVRQTLSVTSLPLEYHTGVETWDFYTNWRCRRWRFLCQVLSCCFPCSSKPSPDPCSAEGYQSWSYTACQPSLCHPTSKSSSLAQSPPLIHPHILCSACPPHVQGATAVEMDLPCPCKRTPSLFLTINNL